MSAGEWVALIVGVIAILAAAWRTTRAIYRLVRTWETGFGEVAAMKKELHPNGGNSLRDVVDETYRIAISNGEATARLETQAARAEAAAGNAARLAADAAVVASRADQRLAELQVEQKALREEQAQRHAENVSRLDALEDTDEAQAVARDFFLGILRKQYGIDLLIDEDEASSEGR